MKRFFFSIRARLALVVIAGIVPAVLLVSLLSAWRETSRRAATAEAELNAIADALAVTLSLPLSVGHQPDVVRALRAVGRMPNLRYARVVTTNGESIAEFGSGVVLTTGGPRSAPLAGASFIDALNLKDHAFSVPIVSGGVRVGRLDIIADVSWLSDAFRGTALSALIWAFAAASLGLITAIPILALVIQPLSSVVQAMRRVQRTADYSPVEQVGSTIETQLLVTSFNAMLDEIHARDVKLSRHRATLEQAVEERTAELKIARQAAETASAAKSEFLAAMSHEIRTPLHGMLITAELLETSRLDEQQRRLVQMITRSGKSLVTIVNDILDLSKIEAGRLELESVPLQPGALAAHVVEMFEAKAAGKSIALQMECGDDVPAWIAGDPVRLTQIVSNLVGNAIKFTAEGGVTVALSVVPARGSGAASLRIDVRDTGIGIASANLSRIFDAFEQAGSDTTRHFGGTGIGLSISRKLANAMGGTIDVESRLGVGSTFTCSIPLTPAEAPATAADSTATERLANLAGLRILAADDNAVNRLVLEASLDRVGALVTSVENGAEAVAAFKVQAFDLVLMDCSMPVMDGYAATREIRALEAATGLAATPIIALTAHVVGRAASTWREAGMSDYLTKPFTQSGLVETIAAWSPVARVATPGNAGTGDVAVSEVAAEALLSGTDGVTPQDLSEPKHANTLDETVLLQIQQMDRDGRLLRRLLGLYESQGRTAIDKLGVALETGPAREIASLAHALKSMSLSIGAHGLASMASDIEARAEAGKTLGDVNGAMLLAAFQNTVRALEDWVTAPPASNGKAAAGRGGARH